MTHKFEISQYNKTSAEDLSNVIIYDSTLREGAQVPGVRFSIEDKLEIAQKLDEIGVPQIEAGFPCVSEEEKLAVKKVKGLGLNAEILALSRLKSEDIDACIECDVDLILLFIATSDLHLKHKYRCSREDIHERMVDSLEYAKAHGIRASFSSEDATRTDIDFLKQLFSHAQDLGAERIGIADTTGCGHPSGIRWLVKELKTIASKSISIHLHNDFGLALANALVGVEEGAKAVGVTVNGIGERAGNVPLEQFVVAMRVLYNVDLGIDTSKLKELSELVSKASKVPISPIAPWIGANVFAHESGIHALAVKENPYTYECIPPEFVGNRRRILIGRGSGRTILREKLKELDVPIKNDDELERILSDVKNSNRILTDEDLRRIAMDVLRS